MLLLAAFLMQGFQCASKEMTTAKMKYEQKDYTAAIDNLQKELAKNPTNEEALLLLIDIRTMQGDLKEAAKILMDAESKSTNPKYKDQFPKKKNKLWVNSYNKGIQYYSSYFSTQEKANLDSAIYYFEIGSILRPTLLDFYFLIGNSSELKGDTTKSINNYKIYIEKLSGDIEFANSNKFYLNMKITNVIDAIGKKVKTRIDTLQNKEINRIDIVDGNEDIYLFSKYNSGTNQFELKGWRKGFPSDWLENEKLNFTEIRTDLFFILSEHFYKNKKLEQSLKYLEEYQKIDPTNNNSNSSIIQIYRELGKEDVALNKLEGLTKSSPGNPLYWSMWADMLANLEKHDEAIEKYEKALEINPEYDYALRNIASTYKNKAVKIQEAEQQKVEADNTYKIDVEKYFPILKLSSENFEKSLKTETFKNDYNVLIELANNYIVLGNLKEPKLLRVLNDFNRIEAFVPQDEKSDFYFKWLKIASDMKDGNMINKVQNKINQLEGK